MNPLQLDEIVGRERYAALRNDYRDAVIAHKKTRRIGVGDKVTLLFEDRETLRFQVQEMLWVEDIRDPQKIQLELDVYNELIPGNRELSATLFIEITEMENIRPELDRLIGLDEHVALGLGRGEDTVWVRARFDPNQHEEDRISAVHYLRFTLDDDSAARLGDPDVTARLRVDHPNYRCEIELPEPLRKSLIGDLEREPRPLLVAGDEQPLEPEVLSKGHRVRTISTPSPALHIIVEPIEAVASLLEADDALVAELLEAVRRTAADIVATHGACRVQTDIGGSAERLQWHLLAPRH